MDIKIRQIKEINKNIRAIERDICKRRAWRYTIIRQHVNELLESTCPLFCTYGDREFINPQSRQFNKFFFYWSSEMRIFFGCIDQTRLWDFERNFSNIIWEIRHINPQWRTILGNILLEYMPKELGNMVYLFLFDPTLHPTYFKNRQLFGTISKRNRKKLSKQK